MDNSGFPSHRSASSISTSNQTLDTNGITGGTSNSSEFVNHGLLLWNQTRQQWVGNKGPQKSGQEAQEAKLSFNTTYEGLLGSNKPFPQPIPLTSSTGSSSKRTKHTAGGQYSSSEGGEGNASQEVEFPTSDAGGSFGTRRRPQGNKAAKAARARAGRGRGESSQAGSQGTPPPSLMSMYFTATMADTSRMTPYQYEAHLDGIECLRSQLGIPPRSNLGAPPPTSGDDSPAE